MRSSCLSFWVHSPKKEKEMNPTQKNILKKIGLFALVPLSFGVLVFATSNPVTQEKEPTYGDMLPTCEEQWLNENFFVPNSKSFKEPWSPQLAAFSWEYCQRALEIDKKAVNKFSEIDNNRDKNLLELLHDVSNFYCYGSYGECGTKEDTLYQQYLDSCESAFTSAQERLSEVDEDFVMDDAFFENYNMHCASLARSKLKTYRDMASIQIVKNQTKLVEESNLKKFLHNREQLDVASDIDSNLLGKLSDAAVNFAGFNREHDLKAGFTRNEPYDQINNGNVNIPGPKEHDVYTGSGSQILSIPSTR